MPIITVFDRLIEIIFLWSCFYAFFFIDSQNLKFFIEDGRVASTYAPHTFLQILLFFCFFSWYISFVFFLPSYNQQLFRSDSIIQYLIHLLSIDKKWMSINFRLSGERKRAKKTLTKTNEMRWGTNKWENRMHWNVNVQGLVVFMCTTNQFGSYDIFLPQR